MIYVLELTEAMRVEGVVVMVVVVVVVVVAVVVAKHKLEFYYNIHKVVQSLSIQPKHLFCSYCGEDEILFLFLL